MIWFTGISVIIILLYILLIYNFFHSWENYPPFTENAGKPLFISIVIPFFNEYENINFLSKDLGNQNQSEEWFEIILVDDYSNDQSFQIASYEFRNQKHIQVLKNEYSKGKKYALKTGIEKAKGNIILTTDADCRIGDSWVQTFSTFFSLNPSTMLLSSGVTMRSQSNFAEKFQSLEFASLVASGAASFMQGSAIMCNGANLAFRKELFLEAFDNLHPEINTGDDMFLMLYTKKMYPGKLAFLKSPKAFSETRALPGWKEFIRQRIRWSSKSGLYRDGRLIYIALMILALNLILFTMVVLSFFNIYYAILLTGMVLLKSIADFIFLRSFLRFSRQDDLLKFFLPSQLIYVFFVPAMGITGLLQPLFRTGKK